MARKTRVKPDPDGKIRSAARPRTPIEAARLIALSILSRDADRLAVERKLGFGNGWVSRVLRGIVTDPPVTKALRVEAVLGVPVSAWGRSAKGPVPDIPRTTRAA